MGYTEVGKEIKTRWFLLRGPNSKISHKGDRSGQGQRRQRALAVHTGQETWTRGISPLPSQYRFSHNLKSAATTASQECLKMARGQTPIIGASIIL